MRSTIIFLSFVLLSVAEDQFLQYGAGNRELARYRERVKILHDLLIEECQVKSVDRLRRELVTDEMVDNALMDLRVEKLLYARLRKMLIDCQHKKFVKDTTTLKTAPPTKPTTTPTTTTTTTTTPAPTTTPTTTTTPVPTTTPTTTTTPAPTTTPTTTTTPAPTTTPTTTTTPAPTTTPTTTTTPAPTTTPTTTTTPAPTTTPTTTTPPAPTTTPTTTTPPPPSECINAVNLTENWRLDHTGSNLKPIRNRWNCDTRTMVYTGRPWFRFSGNAGTRMLNQCPPSLSCGSAGSIWSDQPLPKVIGQETAVHAYTRYGGNCKHMTWKMSVMRCSTDFNDIVYKFQGGDRCYNSFCGMK